MTDPELPAPERAPTRRERQALEQRQGRTRLNRKGEAVPRRRRWPWVVGSIVLVLAIAAGGAYWYVQHVRSTLADVQRLGDDVFPGDETDRVEDAAPDALNILLLGSDSRGALPTDIAEVAERSDTIMVAHIPADRQSVQIMSIMRDSYVDIPGYGTDKINAALSEGGVQLTVQTVESLIGDRIDHIAVLGFDSFGAITDVLGGITVQNDYSFRPSELRSAYFEKGELTLNTGEEALSFVRERKAFPDGDYQRVRNQQYFIKGMLEKMLEVGALSNPVILEQLLTAMQPYMALDNGLSTRTMIDLAGELGEIPVEDVTFFTMPTLGTGTERGQSVVYVNDEWVELLAEHFAADDLDAFLVKPVEDDAAE